MKMNWGTGLIIFFAVFLTFVASFLIFAFNQQNDLVADDYYQQGADYTNQINKNIRSRVFNDSIFIRNNAESFSIKSAFGLKKITDSLKINFYRPSNKKMDFTLSIKCDTVWQTVPKDKLSHGRYKVKFVWKALTDDFEITKDIDIQ
jgi:hypothetical protein